MWRIKRYITKIKIKRRKKRTIKDLSFILKLLRNDNMPTKIEQFFYFLTRERVLIKYLDNTLPKWRKLLRNDKKRIIAYKSIMYDDMTFAIPSSFEWKGLFWRRIYNKSINALKEGRYGRLFVWSSFSYELKNWIEDSYNSY